MILLGVHRLARANALGEATLDQIPRGAQRVRVRKLGYAPSEIDVPMVGDTTGALPLPRAADRTVSVSAGDLDEAIQTIIGVSDLESDDDVRGGLFEKIGAFRQGVVGGLDSCLAEL